MKQRNCNETDRTVAVYTEKGSTEQVDKLLASKTMQFATFKPSTDDSGSPIELFVYTAVVALPVINGRYGFYAHHSNYVLPPGIFRAEATPERQTGMSGTWRALE